MTSYTRDNYLFFEPGQRRDLRAERDALVPRKKVPDKFHLQPAEVHQRPSGLEFYEEIYITLPIGLPADPKIRTSRAPCSAAMRRISSRLSSRSRLSFMLRPRSVRMAHLAEIPMIMLASRGPKIIPSDIYRFVPLP
jgi:hypothetical protein